ncbi:MarR family winged helix-turn-helix transcriptional regulator (plasmid) [Deinococcus radiomollis]|uniref:MarR family winged helix-turn-helix transcriptional regulator n=1 Tax=Deinococcus radiomollis TaxID=468916 RepID=UPI0038913557
MKTSLSDPPPTDPPIPPSEATVSDLMSAWWDATQAMKRHVAPMLEREHGLEFKDFAALSAIESGSNYPGLMCGRLGMTPSAVSRVIDDLVKGGLIVRRLDEHDSRRVQLTLTPSGVQVLSATRQTMHSVLASGLQGRPEAQLQAFVQTLRQLGAAFNMTGPSLPQTAPPAAPETEHP